MIKKKAKTLHDKLVKKVLSDPEGAQEYRAFKFQLELAEKLKKARLKANLTQEAVAERMETKKSVIARLEAAGGKGKHSPSFSTIIRYAEAIGFHVKISLKQDKQVGEHR